MKKQMLALTPRSKKNKSLNHDDSEFAKHKNQFLLGLIPKPGLINKRLQANVSRHKFPEYSQPLRSPRQATTEKQERWSLQRWQLILQSERRVFARFDGDVMEM